MTDKRKRKLAAEELMKAHGITEPAALRLLDTPMYAREVAELYKVHISTVYRWIESKAFDPEPTVVPSPTGQKDRVFFDRAAVMDQHRRETATR